jgi:YbbR domain-containing protein
VNFLRHNLVEKFLAAALALLLFWSVERTFIPEKEETFSKRVVYENVPRGMKVLGESPLIQLTATGNPEVMKDLATGDQQAVVVSVRLDSARRGTSSYPVYIAIPPDLQDEVRWKVSPKRIELTLAGETDVPVTVEAVPTTQPPPGFDDKAWVAEPRTVMVSADETVLERVAKAQIRYDPRDMPEAQLLHDIVLVDRNGRIVTKGEVTLSPSRGRVIPTKTTPVSKLLAIVPQWSGTLPVGYRLVGYKISPAQVPAQGASAVLDSLSVLMTETIDITGMTDDRTVTVQVVAPDGIRLRQGVSVQVQLQIGKAEEP